MNDNANESFVRNAWYVAAWSEEIPQGRLLARTILNQPIALYRDAAGKVAALEDRCCHRGAPLTKGELVPQGVQCGYHGMIFDGTGKCVQIPGSDTVPPGIGVRPYPIVERQQFVWIWMGDPARADASQIVDWPYHDQPDQWPHCKDVIHIQANYVMMVDNLMDLTHLGYIHRKTIGGNPKVHVDAKQETVSTKNGVRFTRWMLNSKPPPTYVNAYGFKGNVDRWQEFEYIAPGTVLQWSGALELEQNAYANRNQPGFHFRLYHGITPETDRSCHYFWSTANGHRQDDPECIKQTYAEIYPTFLEDKDMLEAQQTRIDLDPSRQLIAIPSDKALSYARRALRDMIEADKALTRVAAE